MRLADGVRLSGTEIKTCETCSALANKAIAKMGQDDSLPPSSAKIKMLLKLLQDIETRSQQTEKTIVFSQFTSFLNLIEPFLKAKGIKFVRCKLDHSTRHNIAELMM